MKVVFDRESLYEQVWNIPMNKLAKQYNISDVGLKKICKKLNIPTPPRGYWARISHGYKDRKIPLPKLSLGQPIQHVHEKQRIQSYRVRNDISDYDSLSDEADEIIKKLENDKIPCVVKEKLFSPHPLVQKTKSILTETTPHHIYGFLRPWRREYLNIRVTPSSLGRSLRIMDAIVKSFETIGATVGTDVYPHARLPFTHFKLFDHKIFFSLSEKLSRIPHVDDGKSEDWLYSQKYDYIATGVLTLNFEACGVEGLRRNWSDSPKTKLESNIRQALIGAVKIADAHRWDYIRREEEKQLRQLEKERLAEERRREEREKQRRLKLEAQATMWRKSQDIYQFIQAVEDTFSDETSQVGVANLKRWILWAKKCADDINPLNSDFSTIEGHIEDSAPDNP
jgi:hypothetical protein